MNRKVLKLGAALVVVALSAWGAFALSMDQTRIMVDRAYATKQTAYYRFTINWNDANIGVGQKFGRFLKNTYISSISCNVTTAFNAATTNVLRVGPTTAGEIIASNGANKTINLASATYQTVTAAGSLGVGPTSDADHDILAQYAQTGTAATAGSAICVLEFMPPIDL